MVTLLTVRDAVKHSGEVSLGLLAFELSVSPRWLATLLDELVLRGRVRRCVATVTCQQNCRGCDDQSEDIIYRWIGADILTVSS